MPALSRSQAIQCTYYSLTTLSHSAKSSNQLPICRFAVLLTSSGDRVIRRTFSTRGQRVLSSLAHGIRSHDDLDRDLKTKASTGTHIQFRSMKRIYQCLSVCLKHSNHNCREATTATKEIDV